MANTQSISGLRAQIWRKELWADVMDKLYFNVMGMMGKSAPNVAPNAIIHVMDDLAKKNGDRINIGLSAKLGQTTGVTGDSELEGNESAISYYSGSIYIDQWRDAVRLTGRLDEQESAIDLRTDAKDKLSIRIRELIEKQVFVKLGGVTNDSLVDVNGSAYTGTFVNGASVSTWSNTPTKIADADTAAGTGARYLCSNSGGADALTSSDLITPQLLLQAKVKAELSQPRIDPIELNGKQWYVVFLHPWQMYDLKNNPVMAQALREAWWRGEDNPLFSGADLVWEGMVIHSHKYVPYLKTATAGYNFNATGSGTQYNTDAFRALFCGKQAVAFAKCQDGPKWEEKTFDYGNKWAISCGVMGGIQKVLFNSKEYGVIAIDTAATSLA